MTRTPARREYDFPNATIKIIGRKCYEFPKWCLMIHVERSRQWTARALQMLRRHRKGLHFMGEPRT